MNKTMKQKKFATPWLTHINSIMAKKNSGINQVHDNKVTSITVEWHIVPLMTPEYVALLAQVSDLAIDSLTNVELQFVRAFPESVDTDPIFFEALEPLFRHGVQAVDWHAVEQKIRDQIRGYYIFDFEITDELVEFYSDRFACFVMAKDSRTGELLGYIMYEAQPDCSYGMLKLTGIAVKPSIQKRGLGKLLLNSIVSIIPEVKDIYVATRVTNIAALAAYSAWGFVRIDPAPGSEFMYDPHYWVFMQYNVGDRS